jgi:hydroxyethylthiazole kinase-like uncharacterized protein yjeF
LDPRSYDLVQAGCLRSLWAQYPYGSKEQAHEKIGIPLFKPRCGEAARLSGILPYPIETLGYLRSSLLYRVDELRRLEERAAAGLPPGTLMQRAGQSAADWIEAWFAARGAPSARVLILCGPGNNGGDGYACAEALRRLGRHCDCWSPRTGNSRDACDARARWESGGGSVLAQLPPAQHYALVVDALFGIGLERPLDGAYLDALRFVQAQELPLLALDLPSGIDADTGAWIGGIAGAPARWTITFLGDKPGLHTLEGIDAAGTVTVATLGVQDAQGRGLGCLADPSLFAGLLRRRPANCNKGDFGSVDIVGGAPGMVGAGLLSGRAALRLGAGKVFIDAPGEPSLAVDLLQPELMFRTPARRPASGAGSDVLVVGCGLGTDATARQCVAHALEHRGALVIDADALNLLSADADLRKRLGARAPADTVITPHPGEAGRLLAKDTPSVQRDRVGNALELARTLGCIAVLKGAGSVIALPPALAGSGAPYFINPTGGPALASAGSGDVLAGMIGSLLAQHAHARLEAVLAAVWLHGRAADDFGADVGLVASDIAPLAAKALARLRHAS